MKKKRTLCFLWALLLLGFTVYASLDTFVIQRAYVIQTTETDDPEIAAPLRSAFASTATPPPASQPQGRRFSPVPTSIAVSSPAPTDAPVSTENSYADENVSITIRTIRAYDSTVYVADVVLSDPEHLKTALAKSAYGRNVKAKTSAIAKSANAILAVNGDYYGARDSGYVIRNGVLYRSKAKRNGEDLVIYADGSFEIIRESQISAQDLLAKGAWNVLSFGPGLVIDGKITIGIEDKAGQAKARNPRTAIGIVDRLHYLFVVSDGRTKRSEGLTLRELAMVLLELGCTTAYNLDGGGSSTMVFQGRIVNKPTSNGKKITERSVSDIVCITY